MVDTNTLNNFKKHCPCCLRDWEYDPCKSHTGSLQKRIRCPSSCFGYGVLTCHATDLNDLWHRAWDRYAFKLGANKLSQLCNEPVRLRDFRLTFLEQYIKKTVNCHGDELVFLGGFPQNEAPKGYKKCIHWNVVFFNKTEGLLYSLDSDSPCSVREFSTFSSVKLKKSKLLSEEELITYGIGDIGCLDIYSVIDGKYLFK